MARGEGANAALMWGRDHARGSRLGATVEAMAGNVGAGKTQSMRRPA